MTFWVILTDLCLLVFGRPPQIFKKLISWWQIWDGHYQPQKNKKQKQQHYKQTLVACWSQFRASNLLVWVVNKCVSVAVPVKWRSRVIGFGLNIVRPKVWHKRPGVHSIVKLNTTCNKKIYIKHRQNGSKLYQFIFMIRDTWYLLLSKKG